MKSKLLSFLLVTLSLTLLVGCKEKKRTDIVFGNNSYTVTKPENWKVQKGLNAQADVQLGNDFNEAYAVIVVEAKIHAENISLGSYSKLTLDLLTTEMTDIKLADADDINITGFRAIKQEFTAKVSGTPVKYWHVTLETEKNFIQMFLWSSKAKFEQNRNDFERFMNSFNRAY